MQELVFEVRGSAAEPYQVTFAKRDGGNLSAYCSCAAGVNGQYCKHRLNILSGETKRIVSDNVKDVETVLAWLRGTDVQAAVEAMCGLTVEAARITKPLAAAKKDVARAMRD